MRYVIREFQEDPDLREKESNIFDKIETIVKLSREEMEKNIKSKDDNGECTLMYNNEDRKGVIMALSTNGSYTIGILKDESPTFEDSVGNRRFLSWIRENYE
jgi:hypothetical protein